MSDEAARPHNDAITPIEQDALYLFTGNQLEAILLEAAGMLSHAMLPADKVMPVKEIEVCLSVGLLDHDGLGDAATRGALLKNPPQEPVAGTTAAGPVPDELLDANDRVRRRLVTVGTEAIEAQVGVDPSITAAAEAIARVVVNAFLLELDPGIEPSASTQPQFAVGDDVTIEGHHAHVLPPLIEDVELPLPGKVVRTSPDDPGFVGVRIELPSPVGEAVVRLHVDQIESAPPPAPEGSSD